MFNRYEDYYQSEITHIIRNQRFYWGRDYGQWPSYVIEILKNQGRTPPTYNITAAKIEKELGSFIANGFDMKWETVSGKNSNWANYLTDMALSDKRNCDWQTSKVIAMRDMKVCVGYERMVISDRFDSTFGNIGFEPLPPTHIYIDPSWKTPHAWDIDNYFEWGMFTPSQIIEMFPNVADELAEWKEREEFTGINFGDYNAGVQRWQTTEQKWGDYHKVITFHSLRKYTRDWEYDLINKCPFPETGFPEGSKEEAEAKRQYIVEAGLNEGDYTVVKQKKREKRIEVKCPTLNIEMFLAAGKDRIQTNNCNIYPLGNSMYGQFRGVVDDLYDINIDFNKEQMNENEMMLTAAKGSYIMDEALAGGDEGKKREIEMRSNVPGSKIWVAEGTTQDLGPHGGIIELPHQPIPTDMFNYSGRKLDLADWLTSPAAMDSRNDNPNASGKLFQSQVQVGLVGQQYPMSIIERNETEKMMAYALQSKITYSGYPRTFAKSEGKGEPLEINTPGVDPIGRRIIINNISKMPEMKCTLVKSLSGLNIRSELRDNYLGSLQQFNDPNDRLAKLIIMEALAQTMDYSDETKEELRKAYMMLKANAALALTLNQRRLMMQLQGPAVVQPQQQVIDNQPDVTEGKFDEIEAQRGTLQEQPQLMEAA
jgi:hypothetical protein